MAFGFGNVVELAFTARDEASRKIQLLSSELGGLGKAAGAASLSAGPLLALAGAAIAAGTAIFGLAKAFADEVEQLDNTSARLGVAVPNLQALSFALKQQGVSGDSATLSLQFLNRAIAQNDPLLGRLGITTRDTWAAFVQLIGILHESPDAAARTEVAVRLLGRGAGEALGPLLKLADALPTLTADLQRAGNVSSEKQLAAGREADAILDRATAKMNAIQRWLQGAAARALIGITESPGGAIGAGLMGPFMGPILGPVLDRTFHADQPGMLSVHETSGAGAAGSAKAARAAVVDLNAALREGLSDIRAYALGIAELIGPGAQGLGLRRGLTGNAPLPALVKVNVPALRDLREQTESAKEFSISIAQSAAFSLESIAANFSNKMQTIGSASRLFWNSLVSDILAATARLAERKLLGPGLSFLGTLLGGPIGGIIGGIAGQLIGGSSAATPRMGEGGGDTYNISGLNTRDLVMELRNPGGQLRRAQDRVVLATSY